MYRILKQEGRAKRAELTTVHGTIQTPVFMNVPDLNMTTAGSEP